MIFSSNTFRLAFVLAAALNLVTYAQDDPNDINIDLGAAGNFAILGKTGISTVPTSVIKGDIAISPAAQTKMTGFSFTADSGGTYWTSTQLVETSKAYASTSVAPIPGELTTTVSNMEAAYTSAAGKTKAVGPRLNLGTGTLGGVFGGKFKADGTSAKLTPGVYTWGSNVVIDDDIYFDGADYDENGVATDNTDALFLMQITGNLEQVTKKNVHLSGGAKAENIVWQVSGYVHIGESAHLEGILLVQTDVLFETSSSLNGRVLSQTACNLQMATITQP
jgi:hypothetical protein